MGESSTNYPLVDLHYLGFFTPKPLVYSHGDKKEIRGVDLQAKSWPEFKSFVNDLSSCSLQKMYYSPSKMRLSTGLQALQSECDYNDFLECVYGGNGVVNVYNDMMAEPLFQWIAGEEDDEEEDFQLDEDEDENFDLPDNDEPDHAKDSYVLPNRGGGVV